MLLAVITGVSIVFRFSFFFTFLETMPFRIVPVCVPSVRKWGAYNMKTIIDKFDFKFANRVKLFPTQCNATNLQGSRGEERKRTEEMLGRRVVKVEPCADNRHQISCRLTFPDWLVVKHLGECMDKDNFADLINMMANNLDDVDVDEEKVGNREEA